MYRILDRCSVVLMKRKHWCASVDEWKYEVKHEVRPEVRGQGLSFSSAKMLKGKNKVPG